LSLDIASPGLRPVQCASSVLTVSYILSKRQRFDLKVAQNMLQDMQSEISILITKLQQNLECLSQLPLEETTKTRDLQDEARRLEMPSILCKTKIDFRGSHAC